MANGIPKWTDAQLSTDLPNVRAAGESPTVEFKERFPDQAHRLAQELAALGTSGGGVLYIGINDNGDLVGVQVPDGNTRDDLVERVQGTMGTIRPNLRADILFAIEDDTPVLAIRVPLEDEPVFYYDYRPYIRDGRRSRRASPDEVKERVWAHPSAQFKREAERIKLQQMQDIANLGRG
ncbi:MAG TPA: ATP-binding protein [Gemmataceae bacterium]|nr:ATP-binding protein [Gemmataceae bacterium]